MVQHINLLSKRKARKGLVAVFWAGLGLWVLALAVIAASSEWQLQKQRNTEDQTRQSLDNLKATLEKKRQEYGQAERESMSKQMALLQGQLDARRDWADLLQKGELGNPLGYSQWFETLAAVHVEGVWLQGMNIEKTGQSVSIAGKALGTEAVLRYIDQLNEAFKPMNVRFSSMEITPDNSVGDSSSRATLSFKLY